MVTRKKTDNTRIIVILLFVIAFLLAGILFSTQQYPYLGKSCCAWKKGSKYCPLSKKGSLKGSGSQDTSPQKNFGTK